MTSNTKRNVLAVEIPRDELALRIAIQCTGIQPPIGMAAATALDQMNFQRGGGGGHLPMGETFRLAADAAVTYLAECINAGQRPS